MKNLTDCLCVVVLMSVAVGTASAALHDRGAGMIYDDVLNVTWLQDANHAGSAMYLGVAAAWAADLEYGGYDNWRLPTSDKNGDGRIVAWNEPTSSEVTCRDNEYAYMFYYNLGGTHLSPLTGNQTVGDVTIYNIQPVYWSSSWGAGQPIEFRYDMGWGAQGHTNYLRTPWAVGDGDVMAVSAETSTWGRVKVLYR